jgi:hypothetical protein
MTAQVSKTSSGASQEVAQQQYQQQQREVETQERHAKASASVCLFHLPDVPPSRVLCRWGMGKLTTLFLYKAGLNLNIFGALSGALSSKSRKETHTAPDGSKRAVEDRDTQGEFVCRVRSDTRLWSFLGVFFP